MAKQNTSDSQPIYYLLGTPFSRFWNKYQSLFGLSGGKRCNYIDACLYVLNQVIYVA
jgi:hypothetical protein